MTNGRIGLNEKKLIVLRKIRPNIPPNNVPINLFLPILREFSTVSCMQITAAIGAKSEFCQNRRQIKTASPVLIFLEPIEGNSIFFTVSTPIFFYTLYHRFYRGFLIKDVANIELIDIKLFYELE